MQKAASEAARFIVGEKVKPTEYGDGVRQAFAGTSYEIGASFGLYIYKDGVLKEGGSSAWYPVYENGKPVAVLHMPGADEGSDADGNYSFLYVLKDGSGYSEALASGKAVVSVMTADGNTWYVDSDGNAFWVDGGSPAELDAAIVNALMDADAFSEAGMTSLVLKAGWYDTPVGWVLMGDEYDPEVDPDPAEPYDPDVDPSPAALTGWQKVDGKWYYMGNDGIMRTGWQKVGGKWYYMAGSGAMTTGWQKVDGKWYYMAGSGAMTTGWQKVGGKWYYMDKSGAMVAGKQKN